MKVPFGRSPDGRDVFLYTLKNRSGVEARITDYGGIIVSLRVPDKNGTPGDIVLGYDSLPSYLAENPYFGALIGRYGNRIAGGRFSLDGDEFRLAANNGGNHLHGGMKGFDKVVWEVDEGGSIAERSLALRYSSADGEEGYPGSLDVRVVYALTDSNELRITYTATTDRPTIVNLTHHSYFNLAGHNAGNILTHQMMIDADRYTPVSEGLIPTGELRTVDGTPFDFRVPTAIGARINQPDEQLRFAGGYDHNYVLNKEGFGLAALVAEPQTGRVMEVWTTEPGLQFYSGNFLDGRLRGKGGATYIHRAGLCLETQHFPDSPNQPQFPSTVLRPGETYSSETVYRFTSSGR
jgi:aldose 1-epimerase